MVLRTTIDNKSAITRALGHQNRERVPSIALTLCHPSNHLLCQRKEHIITKRPNTHTQRKCNKQPPRLIGPIPIVVGKKVYVQR
jgi:hypothetical protein